MQTAYRTVGIKMQLSLKMTLAIYQSIFFPNLPNGQTERLRFQLDAPDISFCHVKNSHTQTFTERDETQQSFKKGARFRLPWKAFIVLLLFVYLKSCCVNKESLRVQTLPAFSPPPMHGCRFLRSYRRKQLLRYIKS